MKYLYTLLPVEEELIRQLYEQNENILGNDAKTPNARYNVFKQFERRDGMIKVPLKLHTHETLEIMELYNMEASRLELHKSFARRNCLEIRELKNRVMELQEKQRKLARTNGSHGSEIDDESFRDISPRKMFTSMHENGRGERENEKPSYEDEKNRIKDTLNMMTNKIDEALDSRNTNRTQNLFSHR